MPTVTSPPVAPSLGTGAGRPDADPVRSGLSSAEAQRRLIEFGRNEIRRERAASALALFARQFASPVIWLLAGASVLSAALGELLDAGAIGAIVIVNAVIGFLQEHRAERAVMALHGHGGGGRGGPGDHERGPNARDPVSGMDVALDQGYGKTYGGRNYRLCSRACLDKFDANPNQYASVQEGAQ